MSERRQIARNALSAYGVRGLTAASALLLTPYLFRHLGPAGFGTWSVIFVLWTMLDLLEAGFSSSVVKYVAEFRGSARRTELQQAVGIGVAVMTALGLVAFAATAAAGWAISGLAAAAHERDFRLGLLAIAAAMLVRFPCAPFLAALKGFGRYDLYSLAQAVRIVGLAVGSVAAVELGYGVLGICVAFAVVLALSALTSTFLLVRLDPGLSLRPRLGDRAGRSRLLGFGSFALLAESMAFAAQRMDVVVIAALRNATAAAPYAAALKLQSGVQAVTLPLIALLMPMVSELWGKGDRREAIRRLQLTSRVAVQVTVPLALGIMLFADELTRLWLGAERPPSIVPILVTLLAVQVVTLATAPTESALVGIGAVRTIGVLGLIEGSANVSLSIVLVLEYGAVGAAVATLLTSALLAPLKFPLFCRAAGEPLGPFLRAGVGAGLLAAVPAVAFLVLVWTLLPEAPWRLALAVLGGGLLTVGTAVRQIGLPRLRDELGRPRQARSPEEDELGLGSAVFDRGETVR